MEEIENIETELKVVEKVVKGAKWYAIQVVSGKERKVLEMLDMELNFAGLDKYVSKVLCPMETEYKMRNGKKFKRDKITFPGYIFMEAKLSGELPRVVKNTKWIIDFTKDTATGMPAVVRQSEINRIFGNIEKAESGESPFVEGETVSIIDGPFSSFKGDIDKVDEKNSKLTVNVMVFGRATPLDLSFMQVERIKG